MVGTITDAADFDAERDSKELQQAMKGIGTDESKIIKVLSSRSLSQRLQIKSKFEKTYGKELEAEFRSELGSKFLKLCLAMLQPIAELLSQEIKRNLKDRDELSIVSILVGLDNNGIAELKRSYRQVYKGEIERDVVGDLKGDLKKLIISLLQGNRDESETVDEELATEDAMELFHAGPNKFGTGGSNTALEQGVFRDKVLTRRYEDCFSRILLSRNHLHLKRVFAEYKRKNRRSLESDMGVIKKWRVHAIVNISNAATVGKVTDDDLDTTLRSESTGDLEQGFISIVKSIEGIPKFYAEEIYKSMKGLGTDDSRLILYIVWRSEIDLHDIKDVFEKLYSKDMAEVIKGDTSGDYRSLLLSII